METAVSDLLLAKQAQGGPGLENVIGKVERMKSDTVLLYERLARLGEVVSSARKEEREEGSVAADRKCHLIYNCDIIQIIKCIYSRYFRYGCCSSSGRGRQWGT